MKKEEKLINIKKSILNLLLLSLNENELIEFFSYLSEKNLLNNKIFEIILKNKRLKEIFLQNKLFLNNYLLYKNHYYYNYNNLINFLFDKEILNNNIVKELFEWKKKEINYEPLINFGKKFKINLEDLKIEYFYFYFYFDKELIEEFIEKYEDKIFMEIDNIINNIMTNNIVNINEIEISNKIFFYFYLILQENFYKLKQDLQDKIFKRLQYFLNKIIYLFINSELLLFYKIKKLFFYIFACYTEEDIKSNIKDIFKEEINNILNKNINNKELLNKLNELIDIYIELGELKNEKDTNIIYEKFKENKNLIFYQYGYQILDINTLMRTIEDLIFFELTYSNEDDDISDDELKINIEIFQIINNIMLYVYMNPPNYYYINKVSILDEFNEQLNSNINILIDVPTKLFNEIKFIIYKYHIKYYIKYNFKDNNLLEQFNKIIKLFNKNTLQKLNSLIFNDFIEYQREILNKEELKKFISDYFYNYSNMENLFLLTKIYLNPEFKEYINNLVYIEPENQYMEKKELEYYIYLIYLKNPFIGFKEQKEILMDKNIKNELKKFLLRNNPELDLFLLKLIDRNYLKEVIKNKVLIEKLIL